MANNRLSEDALPAYRRAIASKPGYARAWLNMGISQARNRGHIKECHTDTKPGYENSFICDSGCPKAGEANAVLTLLPSVSRAKLARE